MLAAAAAVATVIIAAALGALRKAQRDFQPPTPALVLVVAHPDDESMFFLPTLLAWPSTERTVVCLSEGGFIAGQGAVRPRELASALRAIGGARDVVVGPFADGPREHWEPAHVASFLRSVLSDDKELARSTLVTFDSRGVSGHANHVATHHGVLVFAAQHPPARLLLLQTPHWAAKYSSIVGAALATAGGGGGVVVAANANVFASIRAMQAHASQFVWYRRLFVVFFVGSFVNSLA